MVEMNAGEKKVKELEDALGMKLRAGVYDLENFEEDWNAFFRNPSDYVGTIVIDMVRQWYAEMYPDDKHVYLGCVSRDEIWR